MEQKFKKIYQGDAYKYILFIKFKINTYKYIYIYQSLLVLTCIINDCPNEEFTGFHKNWLYFIKAMRFYKEAAKYYSADSPQFR